jgi:rifampicin phosphotransferase
MGIIIQEYIEGEQSGVMFIADTVRMDDNQIILNYVDSECCNFVSGSNQSFMVSIEKNTEFAELAAKTEQIFCTHLDIEWTIYKDMLYVLQARPITTFRKRMELEFKNRNENTIYNKLYDEPVPILLRELMDIEASGAFESIGQMEFYGELNYCNGYYYGTQRFMDDVTYQHNEERYKMFVEMMT